MTITIPIVSPLMSKYSTPGMSTDGGNRMPLPSTTLPTISQLIAEMGTVELGSVSIPATLPSSVTQSAAEWAAEQGSSVELGDACLNRRAVQIGAAMAAHPAQSLPQQMEGRAALRGAYGLINHPGITLEQLSRPHWEQTGQVARQARSGPVRARYHRTGLHPPSPERGGGANR